MRALNPTGKQVPLQLDLFRPVEQELLEELQRIDVENTTPLQALHLLMDLQEKVKHKDNV